MLDVQVFQFHTGSIKSNTTADAIRLRLCFNSTLVQLKAPKGAELKGTKNNRSYLKNSLIKFRAWQDAKN
jgi:hypothetical protein